MPDSDLSQRIAEQLDPIVLKVRRRIETELTDRDKAAIAHGLVEAATMGARVAYASVLANAADAGVTLPAGLSVEGLQYQDLWPFEG